MFIPTEDLKFSVKGVYENCSYYFLPNVHNSMMERLATEYITFRGEHLPLVNFIQNKTKGMILGDGGISKTPGVKMAINAHDCVPIMIMGKNMGAIIHVSWKNLYLKILDNVLRVFQRENIDLPNIQVVIGPHIMVQSMEYNLEDLWTNHSYYKKEFFLQKNVNGHIKNYFNIQEMIISVITQWGIKQSNIVKTNIDTVNNEQYASFRRNKINSSQTNIFILEIL